MAEKLESNPNFIVSNAILEQTGRFTTNDIFKSVETRLLALFKQCINELLQFIKDKIIALCEIRLVSDTGFYYYVND